MKNWHCKPQRTNVQQQTRKWNKKGQNNPRFPNANKYIIHYISEKFNYPMLWLSYLNGVSGPNNIKSLSLYKLVQMATGIMTDAHINEAFNWTITQIEMLNNRSLSNMTNFKDMAGIWRNHLKSLMTQIDCMQKYCKLMTGCLQSFNFQNSNKIIFIP